MRPVKAILFLAIAFGLSSLWSQRDYVIDAYREAPEGEQITLSGVDLAITRSTLGQSPYVIPAAPDTRIEAPPNLAFATTDDRFAPIVMVGGEATFSGVVNGPDGPLAGATVEIQRHTADGVAYRTVVTGPDGTWRATGLLGGRYRVRAWLPGVLAMGSSEVVFLDAGASHNFEFSLWGIDPSPTFELVTHEEIYFGVPATVAVVLTRPVIDERGVVVTTPIAGVPVIAATSQNTAILSEPNQVTDGDGVARYVIACSALTTEQAINPGVLVARSEELVDQFPLPACVPVPPPEVDPVAGSSAESSAATSGTEGLDG